MGVPVALLAHLLYNIITVLSFKDLIRRFGLLKVSRRDFYECGFRPQVQKSIQVSLQFLLICVFFLLYDIELVFLFPFVSGFTGTGLVEVVALAIALKLLLGSLIVDYERQVLAWQFN